MAHDHVPFRYSPSSPNNQGVLAEGKKDSAPDSKARRCTINSGGSLARELLEPEIISRPNLRFFYAGTPEKSKSRTAIEKEGNARRKA